MADLKLNVDGNNNVYDKPVDFNKGSKGQLQVPLNQLGLNSPLSKNKAAIGAIANRLSKTSSQSAILRSGERQKLEKTAKNKSFFARNFGTSTDIEKETERFVKTLGGKVYHPAGNGNVVYGKTAQSISNKLSKIQGSDLLVLKRGANLENVASHIDQVLGKRALRNRSPAAMSLLANKLNGKKAGDIIDISVFSRVGHKDTIKADRATTLRTSANTALKNNKKAKSFMYSVAASVKETFNKANDDSAPAHIRKQAREAIINEVGFSVAPVGWLGKGKTLGNVVRAGSVDLHTQSAAKITFDASLNELDKIFVNQTGKIISENPVAKASYERLLKQGTEVRMVRDSGMEDMGGFNKYKNRVIINLDKHSSSKEVVSTLVHEATHQKRYFQFKPKNTQYEEYLSFRNEFLFKESRRPTFTERKEIWDVVQEYYPHLEMKKNPFKGVSNDY